MSKSKIQKSDLLIKYYVQEKTISEIAEFFELGSDESVRYHLRKKDDSGKEIYKSRDREIRQTDQHNMLQVFNDHSQGESFDHDMASVAILTQFRMSKVSAILKPYWEKKYGKAYLREDINMTKNNVEIETKPSQASLDNKTDSSQHFGEILLLDPLSVYPQIDSGVVSLKSVINVMLRPGVSSVVSTGLSVRIPDGYVGMVVPNPRIVKDKNITIVSAPQLVLSSDDEELVVHVYHFGKGSGTTTQQISAGEEVARLLLVKSVDILWKILD